MYRGALVVILLFAAGFSLVSYLYGKNDKTPEGVTKKFVRMLADGECESALEYSTGKATEMVSGSIEMGCEPYETKIIDVACTTVLDSSTCVCTENRPADNKEGFYEMKFIFDLVRVKEQWKVYYYAKDISELEKE